MTTRELRGDRWPKGTENKGTKTTRGRDNKGTELLTQNRLYDINYVEVFYMSRMPRKRSKSGIYHIIMRGINRHMVFAEKSDSIKFIQTVQRYREICEYSLFAYCIMGNHVHLLLKEGKEPLETVMRRICGSYVFWYNRKYNRIGPLFQDRFKSEPVEDEGYFLTVLRYIFQNPVKAGIVDKTENYAGTNYSHYTKENGWSDTDFALDIFETDRAKAVKSFICYVNQENEDVCLDAQDKKQLNDVEAIKLIKKVCKVKHGQDLQKLENQQRNGYLEELKKTHGLSVRQIERLTGISRGIIQKI